MVFKVNPTGPELDTRVPDFALLSTDQFCYSLADVTGEAGLLLGFIGNLWQQSSVRRILWLQNHQAQFMAKGVPVALIVQDSQQMLDGLRLTSPVPLSFPLLADTTGSAHRLYNIEQAGLMVIDRMGYLRDKWLMTDDRVWPREQELLQAIDRLSKLTYTHF